MKSSRMSGGIAGVVLLTIALTGQAVDPKTAVPSKLWDAPPPPAGFPKFQVQEIASDFKIGYAVHICDVNGDGKPDIVVVDQARVVWYENPTWKMRTILTGKTKPDNVCICSLDIDGDGKLDFVLGAGWKPFDTKTPGTLQWLRRGKTLDEEWEMFPIPCDEPTVHRVGVAKLKPDDKHSSIILVPLMGRDATKEQNWMNGQGVRIMAYDLPQDPTRSENWMPRVLDNQLHVVHNFATLSLFATDRILTASYEGIHELVLSKVPSSASLTHPGSQDTPKGNRGASEIAISDPMKQFMIATVEPWHGNRIVAYALNFKSPSKIDRVVIDDHLRWGHAIKWGNLTDEKTDMIVAGVRDNPDPKQGDKFTEKRGVRLYRNTDGKGEKWDRYILEDGGVAVEDLQVADLDGDGKPEIIAVGRATGNCRIYWNKGK
ncbi:VCBS repeat-containing protein [soil metagenome]